MEWFWFAILPATLILAVAAYWRWGRGRGERHAAVKETARAAEQAARPSGFIDQAYTDHQVVTASPFASTETAADDLADIEGIGPRIHDALHEAGITTFAQLAQTSPSRIREVVREGGLLVPIDPETWPMQARLAADGKWAELKRLQDSLKAGVAR